MNPADLNQQVAHLGHDLSSAFEALSFGLGVNIVYQRKHCAYSNTPDSIDQAQAIYVMFVGAEKHLQSGRQGSRTEKKS